MDVQVREVAILQRDVPRGNLPRVLLPQHTGVRPCLVHRSLTVFPLKASVGYERHLLEGVIGRRPAFRHRAHLILELFVPLARHLGNGEIHRAEPRELAVAQAVIIVLRGILRAVHAVVDAHADVALGHRTDFAVLQPQGAGLGLRVHRLDDAHARRSPLVAHLHLRPVIHQQRHHQLPPHEQALHLPIAVLIYLRAKTCQAGGKAVFADNDTFEQRQQELSEIIPVFPYIHVINDTSCFVRIAGIYLLTVYQQVSVDIAQ